MFNYSKLRGLIVEKYGTCAAFASKIGWTPGQLSARLNNKTPFSSADIVTVMDLLEIDADQMQTYFFTLSVR